MRNAILNIFYGPKMLDPKLDTIVVGAWGCGAFGNNTDKMAETFADAVVNYFCDHEYKEIHFAVPSTGGDDNDSVFFQALSRKFKKRLVNMTAHVKGDHAPVGGAG